MLTQNTYPDYFDKEELTSPIEDTSPKDNPKKIEDWMQLQSKRIDLEKLKGSKNLIALTISAISSLLLVISGMLLINLQFWFIPFFIIIFAIFVVSTIFTFLFISSRNIIWIHLLSIGVPFLLVALFTSSLFNGSVFLAIILILFLLFIAFLETENSLALNRVFIFKQVIYQPKKLLILTAFLLTTMGAFMGINTVGGPKFIENTIGRKEIFASFFDPSSRTALLGRALINEKILKQIDGSTSLEKKPLTYQDFLILKLEDSTQAKRAFYETFAEKTYCKEIAIQTDEVCKQKLAQYYQLALATKSLEENGIDVNDPTQVALNSPMTKDNIKKVIQKTYATNLKNFISSSSSATNPLKIYSILGKSEGVSLFIATILFLLLLILFVLFNIIATLVSWGTYKFLMKKKVVSLDIVDDKVEVFKF
jgi:hypothetical protein